MFVFRNINLSKPRKYNITQVKILLHCFCSCLQTSTSL